MQTYNELVLAIDKAHYHTEPQIEELLETKRELKEARAELKKMKQDTTERFEKLLLSPEMDALIDSKIEEFLNTIKGRVLKALGFTNEYIKPIICPIITGIGPDISKLF